MKSEKMTFFELMQGIYDTGRFPKKIAVNGSTYELSKVDTFLDLPIYEYRETNHAWYGDLLSHISERYAFSELYTLKQFEVIEDDTM